MPDWQPLVGPLQARRTGTGSRVVFLHGFTQTGRSWEPVAEIVADAGFEVVTVDLPGHGDNGHVRADLRRTADLISATTGQANFVGYSLGGRIALHLAIMAPHIIRRLVLIGVDPGIDDEDERAQRRISDDALANRIVEIGVPAFLAEWTALPLFAGLQMTDVDRAEREANDAEALADSLRLCGTGTQLSKWARLPELNMPVLAMAGALDAKFAPIAERIATMVPDGEVSLVPDATHAAHLMQPKYVAGRILRFLGKRVPLV